MNKIHFHSFDALRFFAFLKVYLLHIPLQGNFQIFSFLKSGGGIGVSFFFVLSGFLITYILTVEKINKQQIDLKKFFIRRSIRIWPLYFLILFIVYLLPYEFKQTYGLHLISHGYELDWRYSFSFLENYKMLIVDSPPKTTPLSVFWSLCIEEHFYLLWMFCLFIIPIKHFVKFFIIAFIISWISRYFEPFIFNNQTIETSDLFTNLDYFASGAILGFLIAKDYHKVAQFIQKINLWIKTMILILILLIVIFQNQILPYQVGTTFFIFRSSVVGIMFTILIALFIPRDSNIKLKSKILNYLGKISYGLYIYHIVFIHITYVYFKTHNIVIDNWQNLSAFIIVTLGGSIVISILSYTFYEKKFLTLRNRITY
ncbi:MAG: acyltransferase [Flavobacteriales bacterium]|nr:acyltransferase [Flavobacteriales bacterium]